MRRTRRGRRVALESLESRCLLSMVVEYPTPLIGAQQASPQEIVSVFGNLWVADQGGGLGAVNPLNPATNQVHATNVLSGTSPQQIAVGPGGFL